MVSALVVMPKCLTVMVARSIARVMMKILYYLDTTYLATKTPTKVLSAVVLCY